MGGENLGMGRREMGLGTRMIGGILMKFWKLEERMGRTKYLIRCRHCF